MNTNLVKYYHQRAGEYDKVYAIPAEQDDLAKATELFREIFSGKDVLEMACGTGFWTEQISMTAASVLATDVNQSMIDIAAARNLNNRVRFEQADMYRLKPAQKFEAVFGGFIWSHIPVEELDAFLDRVKHFLVDGGEVVFIDSNPVSGTIHEQKRIARTDESGNTYQIRLLGDGSSHEVLKNFPTEEFLFQKMSRIATDIRYTALEHYWIVRGKVQDSE